MQLPQETKNKLLLILTGLNLILLNYTLIRQATLAFRNLEISALVMALAYFAGISIGYLRSDLISAQRMKDLLPIFLIFQMLLITLTQLFAEHLKPLTGTITAYAIIFLLVAAGSTSLYSLFLPRLIQSGMENTTRRYYSAEIIGSLVGLFLLPLLSMGGMTMIFAAYFISFLAIGFLLQLRRFTLGLLFLYCLGFTVSFDYIDRRLSTAFYQRFYSGRGVEDIIFTRYSPYHKIEVAKIRNNQRALILNSHWQFGPGSHQNYSYFVAEYPARLMSRPTVALLGCGSMSTVGRMGDYVNLIKIVDLDTAVFETSRIYFSDFNRLSQLHNWTFVSDDAKHFLGTTNDRFDLIIDDIPPAKTRQVALTYTREFFELVRSRLAPQGMFSIPSLTSMNSRNEYGRRILATLAHVFDQVVVINDASSSYFFATGRERTLDRDELYAAITHPRKSHIRLLMPDEARSLIAQERIITLNNMADLINY